MTTQVTTIGRIGTGNRPSLEELVDRVMEAIFAGDRETHEPQSVAKSVHDARRLRQEGDLDGALAVFASVDAGKANEKEARWAYAEWQAETGTCFSLVEGFETELGYFHLSELAESTVLGNVPAVERDLYWEPKTIGEIRRRS